MKVSELLTDESKFVQHCFACNPIGDPVRVIDPSAIRWSLYGAVMKCYSKAVNPSNSFSIEMNIIRRIEAKVNMDIVTYNNTTKFDSIKKLIDSLDI